MEYTAKIRELLAAGDNKKLQAWINNQSMLDQGNIWREVKRIKREEGEIEYVDLKQIIAGYDGFEMDIKVLEHKNLAHLRMKFIEDQERVQENNSDENIAISLNSSREYLVMCYMLKADNTESLKEQALRVLKSERNTGTYNPSNWRGYDDYLEGKSLSEETARALQFRNKILELIKGKDRDALQNWIDSQPISDRPDIFRAVKELSAEVARIQGEDLYKLFPNTDRVDAHIKYCEQILENEKVGEDQFKMLIAEAKNAAKDLMRQKAEVEARIVAAKKRIIAAIQDGTEKTDEFKARVKEFVARDKAAGLFKLEDWSSVIDWIERLE